jgi:hypothetical protein
VIRDVGYNPVVLVLGVNTPPQYQYHSWAVPQYHSVPGQYQYQRLPMRCADHGREMHSTPVLALAIPGPMNTCTHEHLLLGSKVTDSDN